MNEELIQKATAGDVNAQLALGELLATATEENQKPDMTEPLKWFRMAAEQANAQGQYSVGALLANGVGGVEQDYAEALKWFRLAAEQGHAEAQFNLGWIYANDVGLNIFDEAESDRWYAMAAAQGHELAQYRVEANAQMKVWQAEEAAKQAALAAAGNADGSDATPAA